MRKQTQRDAVSDFARRKLCSAGAHSAFRSAEMFSGNSDLNEKLRQRLEQQAESERSRARDALRAHAMAQLISQYAQVLASLKSSYDT